MPTVEELKRELNLAEFEKLEDMQGVESVDYDNGTATAEASGSEYDLYLFEINFDE